MIGWVISTIIDIGSKSEYSAGSSAVGFQQAFDGKGHMRVHHTILAIPSVRCMLYLGIKSRERELCE